MYTIGIDIGGTNLRIGLVDENNGVSHLEKVPQAEILKDNAPEQLADFIASFIERNVKDTSVAGVCAAFPAAIDRDRAVVLNAPNIKGFNGVNVKALLENKLGCPIFIERDVNALLTYDLQRYNVNTGSIVIGCYAGTGLGNAIYINGTLLKGHNGVAGELGHIPAWDMEDICSCGNKGCVESYVGGKYLDAVRRDKYPDTPINELFARHGDDAVLKSYVKHLAATIASEINILDPESVILGGGVLSMDAFPRVALVENIRFFARKPLPEGNLRFILSESAPENGVIGAGACAWNHLRTLK